MRNRSHSNWTDRGGGIVGGGGAREREGAPACARVCPTAHQAILDVWVPEERHAVGARAELGVEQHVHSIPHLLRAVVVADHAGACGCHGVFWRQRVSRWPRASPFVSRPGVPSSFITRLSPYSLDPRCVPLSCAGFFLCPVLCEGGVVKFFSHRRRPPAASRHSGVSEKFGALCSARQTQLWRSRRGLAAETHFSLLSFFTHTHTRFCFFSRTTNTLPDPVFIERGETRPRCFKRDGASNLGDG